MVLDHRRIELGSTVETAQIANNSGTHGMAINTDLLVSNSGNKALGLASVAGPANVFAGLVADGSHDSATQVIRLNKSGAGTWSLANAGNSYTGATTIQQGVLSTGSIGNIGAGASALGNPGSAATGLIVLGAGNNTGTLLYTGPSQSTDRTIQVNSSTNTNTGGAGITNDGSGPLTFTAATFNEAYVLASTVTRTLTLAGTNGGTVQGVVQDNSLTGKIAIAKSGAGTWLLTGTNTYTGNTTINGGALQAIEGVGLGLLPDTIVERGFRSGVLMPVLSDWSSPEASIHAAFTSRHGMLPAVRAFIDFIAERMPVMMARCREIPTRPPNGDDWSI